MRNEFLWVEQYRPRTIDDCILPAGLAKTFNELVKTGELPNMMFSGTAGVGKTTVARALCTQLELDYIVINGSEDGNIDTLRGKIKQFASTVSLSGGYKVVILDEADYLNAQSTQPALRGFIEEFSNNCRFILTCNFKNRIIEPLHSRCSVYEFAIPPKERPKIASKFFKRLQYILDTENVEYENPSLAKLIERHFPDWRRVINECQRYGISGKIDAGVLTNINIENVKSVMEYLGNKEFSKMRKWVANNIDLEATAIFRMIYDNMEDYVKPHAIPQLVLIIADYQYKNSFVADHEINLVAMFTEIMSSVEFK